MFGIRRWWLYENIEVMTSNTKSGEVHWEEEEEGRYTRGGGGTATTTWMALYVLMYHYKQKFLWVFQPLTMIPYK